MDVLIIEIHGFKIRDNNFVVKEVGIASIVSNETRQYIAKPPIPYKHLNHKDRRCVDYTSKYIHGLPWTSGYIPLEEVEKYIIDAVAKATVVYTKGLEKVCFLLDLTQSSPSKIVNLDEYPGITTTAQRDPCFQCIHKNRCALEQAIRYRNFMRLNYYYKL